LAALSPPRNIRRFFAFGLRRVSPLRGQTFGAVGKNPFNHPSRGAVRSLATVGESA